LRINLELEQMKLGKIVKMDKYDQAIKVEDRIKTTLINTKHQYERDVVEASSYKDTRIKNAVHSSQHLTKMNRSDSMNSLASTNKPGGIIRGDSAKRKPDMFVQENQVRRNDYHSEKNLYSSEDYKAIADKQKDEINALLDKERVYKRDIEHYKRQLDEVNKKQAGKYEYEMKQLDRNNNEVKNHYEGILSTKEKEMLLLNKRLTSVENEQENLLIKFLEFMKRTSKYVDNNIDYQQIDRVVSGDIDNYLQIVEKYIYQSHNNTNNNSYYNSNYNNKQSSQDFSRPVQRSSNNVVEDNKVDKLNEMLNDLKNENNQLK
jgi:hypothetical protein